MSDNWDDSDDDWDKDDDELDARLNKLGIGDTNKAAAVPAFDDEEDLAVPIIKDLAARLRTDTLQSTTNSGSATTSQVENGSLPDNNDDEEDDPMDNA